MAMRLRWTDISTKEAWAWMTRNKSDIITVNLPRNRMPENGNIPCEVSLLARDGFPAFRSSYPVRFDKLPKPADLQQDGVDHLSRCLAARRLTPAMTSEFYDARWRAFKAVTGREPSVEAGTRKYAGRRLPAFVEEFLGSQEKDSSIER